MFQEECSLNIKYINIQTLLGWRLAQVVEHLPGKHEILRLNHSTTTNKKFQNTNNITGYGPLYLGSS
jgi:hypothetical protein